MCIFIELRKICLNDYRVSSKNGEKFFGTTRKVRDDNPNMQHFTLQHPGFPELKLDFEVKFTEFELHDNNGFCTSAAPLEKRNHFSHNHFSFLSMLFWHHLYFQFQTPNFWRFSSFLWFSVSNEMMILMVLIQICKFNHQFIWFCQMKSIQ